LENDSENGSEGESEDKWEEDFEDEAEDNDQWKDLPYHPDSPSVDPVPLYTEGNPPPEYETGDYELPPPYTES